MSRRYRGTMLMQMIVAIGLTSMVLTMSVMVVTNTWNLENAARHGDQQGKSYDQFVLFLSRDIEAADEVNITRQILLLDKHTLWKIEGGKITRKTDRRTESWDILGMDIVFQKTSYGLMLKVDDNSERVKHIPLIKTRNWSESVAAQ